MSGDGQLHDESMHKDFKIRLRPRGKDERAAILAEKEFTKGSHGPGGDFGQREWRLSRTLETHPDAETALALVHHCINREHSIASS